ncbi:hypothetical protein ACVWZD_000394 [Streptomyces sp. TE3672]
MRKVNIRRWDHIRIGALLDDVEPSAAPYVGAVIPRGLKTPSALIAPDTRHLATDWGLSGGRTSLNKQVALHLGEIYGTHHAPLGTPDQPAARLRTDAPDSAFLLWQAPYFEEADGQYVAYVPGAGGFESACNTNGVPHIDLIELIASLSETPTLTTRSTRPLIQRGAVPTGDGPSLRARCEHRRAPAGVPVPVKDWSCGARSPLPHFRSAGLRPASGQPPRATGRPRTPCPSTPLQLEPPPPPRLEDPGCRTTAGPLAAPPPPGDGPDRAGRRPPPQSPAP